mmetsp:Transcript_110097/g.351181  ORF Transcript_110097/g.351181 Transcript_110097/m.351181 type:complete len:289 (-) Transcript_110097:1087-1953(-)
MDVVRDSHKPADGKGDDECQRGLAPTILAVCLFAPDGHEPYGHTDAHDAHPGHRGGLHHVLLEPKEGGTNEGQEDDGGPRHVHVRVADVRQVDGPQRATALALVPAQLQPAAELQRDELGGRGERGVQCRERRGDHHEVDEDLHANVGAAPEEPGHVAGLADRAGEARARVPVRGAARGDRALEAARAPAVGGVLLLQPRPVDADHGVEEDEEHRGGPANEEGQEHRLGPPEEGAVGKHWVEEGIGDHAANGPRDGVGPPAGLPAVHLPEALGRLVGERIGAVGEVLV